MASIIPVDEGLFREVIATVQASTAETGVSGQTIEYRETLLERLHALLPGNTERERSIREVAFGPVKAMTEELFDCEVTVQKRGTWIVSPHLHKASSYDLFAEWHERMAAICEERLGEDQPGDTPITLVPRTY